MAMILLFIWTLCYCLNIVVISKQIKEYMTNKTIGEKFEQQDWISILLATVFIVMCMQPCFKTFQAVGRFELFYSLYNIAIAPFGLVRFRDFFLADVITSMGHPLVDIGTTMAYFGGSHWEKRDHKVAKVGFLNVYVIAFAYLPFWWRFW